MSKPFHFKEFSVSQDRCAMKIGTDGVLLGAWTSIDNNPQSILDIGSGTGIIALQLAQRSAAPTIDAVELDDNAYEQCSENFEASPWPDRLFCYHASIQEFASEIDETYDLIVSNPPFYREDFKSAAPARDTARFTDTLPFEHLMVCVAHLLSENGKFSLILPQKEQLRLTELATKQRLHPKRICEVRGTPNSEIKRVLMEFSTMRPAKIISEELTIEIGRHEYTPKYINLVKDFYLKM
ncbi:MAG: methyltransferase [Flavobacteriaceae bacterium]|nr:methyltransferase [Flavobacteriaceae bacterium]